MRKTLLLLLLLSLGRSFAVEPAKPSTPPHPANNGRFVLYQSETRANGTFLVDNLTGATWHMVTCSEQNQPLWQCWEKMEFINTLVKYEGRPRP